MHEEELGSELQHLVEIMELKSVGIILKVFNMRNSDIAYVADVLEQARNLGVEEFIEGGELLFNGVRIVGKGQNCLVVKCRVEGLEDVCACKLLRPDSPRKSLVKEGLMLRRANEVGVGPSLINFSRSILVYKFVEGVPLVSWIPKVGRSRAFELVRNLLEQCYELDRIGVRHGELSRLEGHVLVSSQGRPVIIDFESASFGYWQNVPQVINGLARLGIIKVTPELRLMLRRYKGQGGREVLAEIISRFLS